LIVVEEIARADAAAAWNLMLGATYGLWAAFLPEEAAREIYGAPDAVVAGALRPSGRARPVDGGFVVDGQWSACKRRFSIEPLQQRSSLPEIDSVQTFGEPAINRSE
jgi:hypothetical protein